MFLQLIIFAGYWHIHKICSEEPSKKEAGAGSLKKKSRDFWKYSGGPLGLGVRMVRNLFKCVQEGFLEQYVNSLTRDRAILDLVLGMNPASSSKLWGNMWRTVTTILYVFGYSWKRTSVVLRLRY